MRLHQIIVIVIVLVLGSGCGYFVEKSIPVEYDNPVVFSIQSTTTIVALSINGNDEFEQEATTNEWAGSGLKGSPYEIQTEYFTALLNTPAIWIRNTDVYFEIYDCGIYLGSYGIRLDNVKNGKIDFNWIYEANSHGISMTGECYNINITRNTIYETMSGIYLGQNNNNTLIRDNELFNLTYGMDLRGGYFNTISDNSLYHIDKRGIVLSGNYNSTVSGNTITDIYNTTNNLNYKGIGLTVKYGDYNNISYNNISDIGYYGIDMYQSTRYNLVDHNIISNTQKQAIYFTQSGSTSNTFSNNIIKDINHDAVLSGNSNSYYNNVFQNISLTALVLGYNNIVSGNTIFNSGQHGMRSTSDYNSIINNVIKNCSSAGISLNGADHTIIKSNTILNNTGYGLYLDYVENCTIEDNVLENNGNNFWLTGNTIENYHHVMTNNTINGEELVYIKDSNYPIIPDSFAGLIIVNSTNFEIANKIFDEGRTGLIIANSSHFTVRNNVFRDVLYGLELFATENGVIYRNELYNCWGTGFHNRQTVNMVFRENEIHSNIFFDPSGPAGIYTYECNFTIIADNHIHDNSGYAMITHLSTNATIIRNTIINNSIGGIYSKVDNKSIIANNYIFDTPRYGLRMDVLNHSTVFANNISNCEIAGMYLVNVDNCQIILNELHNNTDNAIDTNGENILFEMNYWDDYSGSDSTGDGFGDTAYSFSTNEDGKPLMAPHVISTPTVISPNGGETLDDIIIIEWANVTDSLNFSITFTILYSTDAGFSWNVLTSNLTDLTYVWDSKDYSNSTQYLCMVLAINSQGVASEDVSDSTFTVNNIAHVLSKPDLIFPTGEESVAGIITIEWTAVVDVWYGSVPVTYAVYYSPNAGSTWVELVGSTSLTTFHWDTTTIVDGSNYLIKIVATSDQGLVREALSSTVFAVVNTIIPTTVPTTTPTTTEFTTEISSEPTTKPTSEGFTTIETSSTKPSGSAPGWTILTLILSLVLIMRKRRRNIL